MKYKFYILQISTVHTIYIICLLGKTFSYAIYIRIKEYDMVWSRDMMVQVQDSQGSVEWMLAMGMRKLEFGVFR